ncbi:hypothetical protein K438DRAFT_1936291 [Mycena galopus ATCC 62051]|nr:hypothetical protein K438DRAFT_1936291 [Mycena galopus ATCC 62051]
MPILLISKTCTSPIKLFSCTPLVPGRSDTPKNRREKGAHSAAALTRSLGDGITALGRLSASFLVIIWLEILLGTTSARLLVLLCRGKGVYLRAEYRTQHALRWPPGAAESVGEHAGVAVLGAYLDQQGLRAGRGRGSVFEPECEWERRCEDERCSEKEVHRLESHTGLESHARLKSHCQVRLLKSMGVRLESHYTGTSVVQDLDSSGHSIKSSSELDGHRAKNI